MAAIADPLATTVVFMGKRTFGELYARLIEHGLPADTPALLGEAVTLDAQRLWRGTLKELARQACQSCFRYTGAYTFRPLG